MATTTRLGRMMASVLVSAAALIGVGTAQAAVVFGSQQTETSTVEDGLISDFTWTFSGLPAGTGTASLRVNYARLDLDNPAERLGVLVDGTSIGFIVNTSNVLCVAGNDATFGGFISDCTGSATFSFDTLLLNDGSLTVSVVNAQDVNSLIDISNGAGWASVEISYEEAAGVPEPASLALVGLALCAAGAARRRRD